MPRFLSSVWYKAVWSQELNIVPLSRRLIDRQVAQFRDSQGRLHAITDRCVHAFAPLNRSEVEGYLLVCPYYDLSYGGRANAGATSSPIGIQSPRTSIPSKSSGGIARYGSGVEIQSRRTLSRSRISRKLTPGRVRVSFVGTGCWKSSTKWASITCDHWLNMLPNPGSSMKSSALFSRRHSTRTTSP